MSHCYCQLPFLIKNVTKKLGFRLISCYNNMSTHVEEIAKKIAKPVKTFFLNMFFKRLLHVSRNVWATDKSALSTLRKKTGYTFANCKKALELHENDLTKVNILLY